MKKKTTYCKRCKSEVSEYYCHKLNCNEIHLHFPCTFPNPIEEPKPMKKVFLCGNCNKKHYTEDYSCSYEPPYMRKDRPNRINNVRISIKGYFDNPTTKLKGRFYIPEKYAGQIIEFIGRVKG